MRQSLEKIYGKEKAAVLIDRISDLLNKYNGLKNKIKSDFSEKDVFLITYGDSIQKGGDAPLNTLKTFADIFLKNVFTTIHLLPFYPYSSDDGFSVIDFQAVNPVLGGWRNIAALNEHFGLMMDYVLNHISAKSGWFDAFLSEKRGFENLAITYPPETDLSIVTRPRTHPLLTPFQKKDGETIYVWTTFSEDQIDLNWADPDVFLRMIDVLLLYVKHGADAIRMDAIAYLWKKYGTTCIHLSETHEMVKLIRKILDEVAPYVMIITETNVPHDENISYFGNGRDEAQAVYNFTLPPLLLYTFLKEDARYLSDWAKTLTTPSDKTTFFNFTASHDGIGVRPLEGILSSDEIADIVKSVTDNGGLVSYKNNPDGSKSPYELNITYVDAMGRENDDPLKSVRFLSSQAVQFSLPGIPAVYILSLLGGGNWLEGVQETGRARTINREKPDFDNIMTDINNPKSFRARVFYPYIHMIRVRKSCKAFHPNASFNILNIGKEVFAIRRGDGSDSVYCFTNVTSKKVCIDLKCVDLLSKPLMDMISGVEVKGDSFILAPCSFVWLTEKG